MSVVKRRIVHLRVAPWLRAYLTWAETMPGPKGEERQELNQLDIMDVWKAGWDAAMANAGPDAGRDAPPERGN